MAGRPSNRARFSGFSEQDAAQECLQRPEAQRLLLLRDPKLTGSADPVRIALAPRDAAPLRAGRSVVPVNDVVS